MCASYQQLEQWNDENEYTRSVQALNATSEEWRDYRSAYALARALVVVGIWSMVLIGR